MYLCAQERMISSRSKFVEQDTFIFGILSHYIYVTGIAFKQDTNITNVNALSTLSYSTNMLVFYACTI